ncbi:ATP-binding protein [Pontimicrobium aquaticum]|uniref:AAA domain-containing protein n=1 Tax=Pontimicrobium aquaticum TaxID=2565367 RepID=A0A4U0F1B8_9FLAO|nr:ATP-binding protein [Pontimicrobium aquaticum]TJY38206.1 hypothetical protein E5167_02830 [Pontimicrobium aquaticum]
MRNLFINRLKYNIGTNVGSKFGADIVFDKGLNIVYGPNSLGKTSIIIGILYSMGLEKSFGIFKSSQNPFKPEFYDVIEGEKISTSFVQLEISNGKKTITIARSIIGKTNVVGIKNCKIKDFHSTKKINYYVAVGDGVASKGGLQHYLYKFLNIPFLEVPTYDGGASKLYFENLTPLFFVEQRAGWSQIQSMQVTRYGIRDVKRVAFEYLMGLDRFESHLIEIRKKEILEKIRRKKAVLGDREEEIIVGINGEKDGSVLLVNRSDIGKTSVHDGLSYLDKKYNRELEVLENLSESDSGLKDENKGLRTRLRRLDYKLRKSIDRANKLNSEISGYVNYIERIQINKAKNRQLKKIENLALTLNINSCPVCETELNVEEEGECKLCHSKLKRKISSPEQNLAFLEDEEKSFKEVLRSKKLELRKVGVAIADQKAKLKELEETIEHSINTYSDSSKSKIKLKVLELDDIREEIKRYRWASRKWQELDYFREELAELEAEKKTIDEKLRDLKYTKGDLEILKSIVDNFRNNVRELELFRSKEQLINQIKIDENDYYTPYLDSYDIYNIVSSSDNVRIILSYYLSLLQTSVKLEKDNNIKFPNILIFDEPKQQNLDNKTLKKFISLIEHIEENKCQIILTTYSHVEKEKNLFEKYICHEMVDSTDYLLKRIS